MKKVLIVGGGPAGLMAAWAAAQQGAEVTLLERNRDIGRKLAITGKGRCNITNNTLDIQELLEHIPGNGSFLHSALRRFGVEDCLDFFTNQGLELKTERGRRVFPASDKAADVVNTLRRTLTDSGVKLETETRVKELYIKDGELLGIKDFSGRVLRADSVIIATGGLSYPATGSTGDGYKLAQQAGHTLIPTRPSLAPLETEESWPAQVSGLSLHNAEVKVYQGDKLLGKDFGELLFTHFGLSGPVILTLSRQVCSQNEQGRGCRVMIDMKPALSPEQLDMRLQRDMQKYSRRIWRNSLDDLLPSSLIPVFVELSGIDPELPVNQITKAQRQTAAELLKGLTLTVKGPRPIGEAIVTAGGVNCREVSPRTMESKLLPGLYFAGEVLDIDGYTGGYNLQAAWSTGYVAGSEAGAI